MEDFKFYEKTQALQKEHPALQNIDFFVFYFLGPILAFLEPDPNMGFLSSIGSYPRSHCFTLVTVYSEFGPHHYFSKH